MTTIMSSIYIHQIYDNAKCINLLLLVVWTFIMKCIATKNMTSKAIFSKFYLKYISIIILNSKHNKNNKKIE